MRYPMMVILYVPVGHHFHRNHKNARVVKQLWRLIDTKYAKEVDIS